MIAKLLDGELLPPEIGFDMAKPGSDFTREAIMRVLPDGKVELISAHQYQHTITLEKEKLDDI